MKIYIPTRGRPYNQETLKWFPKEMQTELQALAIKYYKENK